MDPLTLESAALSADGRSLVILDQTLLPGEVRYLSLTETEDIVEAIGASSPALSLTSMDDEENGHSQMDIPVESQEGRLTELLALKDALGTLAPKDRSLIILRYFQGKTQMETAGMLGMTQVQVSRREKKILLTMRKQLGDP